MDFLDCYIACRTADPEQLWDWIMDEDQELRYAAGRQLQHEQFAAIVSAIEERLSLEFDPRSWEMMAFIIGQPQSQLTSDDIICICDILTRLLDSGNQAVTASVICALGHLYSNDLLGEQDFCRFEQVIRVACDRDDLDIRISLLFAIAFFPHRNFLADYVLQQIQRSRQDPFASQMVPWVLFALEYGPYPSNEADSFLIDIAGTAASDVAAEALVILLQREVDAAVALAEEYCVQRESSLAEDTELEIHDEVLRSLADSRDERLHEIYQRLNAVIEAID